MIAIILVFYKVDEHLMKGYFYLDLGQIYTILLCNFYTFRLGLIKIIKY